jgi:uncharacterized protein YkwD
MRRRLLRHAPVAVLIALVACAFPSAASAATLGCADDATGVSDLTPSWEAELLSLTNAHRTGMGLAALALDPTLTKASVWKARDMARRNYMEHDDPANGAAPSRSPWDRLTACGWASGGSRAENIAAGYTSPQAVITGWLNSPGHRANIENSAMRYVGFGVASSTTSHYGTYSAQMFASVPGPVATAPVAPAPPTIRTLTLTVGDAARILCAPSGATFVLDSATGLVDASIASDGCLTVAAQAAAAVTTATIAYRTRATGGATSTPVDLLVTILDRDRTVQGDDDATGGGGSPQASRVSVTSARYSRTRCRGAWAVRGWCWRIVVRGRVLLADHAASSGRRLVVSRMTATRRLALVGRATTNASGAFTLSARIRPSTRATSTWLARNASRLRIGATTTTTAAAAVAWTTVRR